MATISPVLFKGKKLKNGLFPIMIRINVGEVKRHIGVGHSVKPEHWDVEKRQVTEARSNHKMLNTLIKQKHLYWERVVMMAEINEEDIIKAIDKLTEIKAAPIDLFSYIDLHIERLKKKKDDGYRIFTVLKNALLKHTNKTKLPFSHLDAAFLTNFQVFLEQELKIRKQKGSKSTIHTYFSRLRSIYNKAENELKLNKNDHPFDGWKMPGENKRSIKVKLTDEQFNKLCTLDLKVNSPQWHARNYFLLQYRLMGMRIGDLLTLRYSDIKGDALSYSMNKSADAIYIDLSKEDWDLLNIYWNKDAKSDDFILPILDKERYNKEEFKQKYIDYKTNAINKQLGHLGKAVAASGKLTTHAARHYYSSRADRVLKDTRMVQNMLGHEDEKTTRGYLDELNTTALNKARLEVLN